MKRLLQKLSDWWTLRKCRRDFSKLDEGSQVAFKWLGMTPDDLKRKQEKARAEVK